MSFNKRIVKVIKEIKVKFVDKWQPIIIGEILLILLLLILNKSFLISFISIIIHEFSHIFLAKSKGSSFNKLQVHIYGSEVELMDVDELSDRDKLIIYIAGPISNLIVIAFVTMLNVHIPVPMAKNIISLNLGLAMFNILPAYPLDGARILEILLNKKMIYRKARKIISMISYGIGLVFIVVAVVIIILYDQINLSLFFAGGIIIYITNKEMKTVMYILMGNIYKKRKKLIKNNYIENRVVSVYYKLGLVNLMTIVDKNRFNVFYILDDDLKVMYILCEDELIEALKRFGNITLEEYFSKREK